MITEAEVKSKTPERFWSKITFGDADSCWNWNACKDRDGYGWFRLGRNAEGKHPMIKSHRFMYQEMIGEFDRSLQCLHTCDNPSCCNPKHLWIGTDQDNMTDKKNKGRVKFGITRGSAAKRSKLTEEKVVEIKRLLSQGRTHRQIAKEYGVGKTAIGSIATYRAWTHVRPTN